MRLHRQLPWHCRMVEHLIEETIHPEMESANRIQAANIVAVEVDEAAEAERAAEEERADQAHAAYRASLDDSAEAIARKELRPGRSADEGTRGQSRVPGGAGIPPGGDGEEPRGDRNATYPGDAQSGQQLQLATASPAMPASSSCAPAYRWDHGDSDRVAADPGDSRGGQQMQLAAGSFPMPSNSSRALAYRGGGLSSTIPGDHGGPAMRTSDPCSDCRQRVAVVAMVPCGHVSLCLPCAHVLAKFTPPPGYRKECVVCQCPVSNPEV